MGIILSNQLPIKSLYIQFGNGNPTIIYNNTGVENWIIESITTGKYKISSTTFNVDWTKTVVNVSNINSSNKQYLLSYDSNTTTDTYITIIGTDVNGVFDDNAFLYASVNIAFFQ